MVVSHDRYFLNRIPTRIMELTETGLVNYLGKYDYYVEKKQQLIESGSKYVAGLAKGTAAEGVAFASEDAEEKTGLSAAEERKRKKEIEAEERRLRRKRESLEKEIEQLEEEISKAHDELQKPEVMTDHEKLQSLSDKMAEDKDRLDACYEQWLELQE